MGRVTEKISRSDGKFRRLWRDGSTTVTSIAREYGVTRKTVERAASRFGLGEKTEGNASTYLINEHDEKFRRLWRDESVTIQDIAEVYGIGKTTAVSTAKRLGLGGKARASQLVFGRRPEDPTPEQIEQRCAAIRATWTEERISGDVQGSSRLRRSNGIEYSR